MANFQLSNIQPINTSLPEIKAADLSGFTQGFDKLAKIKTDAEANRIKRNKEKAQKLLVTQVADPEFRARLAKGLGWGPIMEADPDKGMAMLQDGLRQDREDERMRTKLAAQQKDDFKATGSLLNAMNAPKSRAMLMAQKGLYDRLNGTVSSPEEYAAVVEEMLAGNKLTVQDIPGGGKVVTLGNRVFKMDEPKAPAKGSPEQQLVEENIKAGMTPAQAVISARKTLSEAGRDPYVIGETWNAKTGTMDKVEIPRESMRKGGMPLGTATVPETAPVPGAVQIPNASLGNIVTPPDGMPPLFDTPQVASNTPNVLPLGPNQMVPKPTAVKAPEPDGMDKKDIMMKAIDSVSSSPAIKAYSKNLENTANAEAIKGADLWLQDLSKNAQDPTERNRAEKMTKWFGNVQGIGLTFEYMRSLDNSVVRPSEQVMIQRALGWEGNKFKEALNWANRWWNNQESTLSPEAMEVMKMIHAKRGDLLKERAVKDVEATIEDFGQNLGLDETQTTQVITLSKNMPRDVLDEARNRVAARKAAPVASQTVDLSKKTGKDWAQLFNGMKTSTMPMGGQ